MKESKIVRMIDFLSLESKSNRDLTALIEKPSRQLASAHLAALVHRDFLDEKDSLRDLPAAQSLAAEFQQFGFADLRARRDARNHFFVAQDGFASEDNRAADAGEAQQFRFHFGRVHFFPGDIDDIGNAPDDTEPVAASAQQIVR